MRRRVLIGTLGSIGLSVGAVLSLPQQDPFDHLEHAGLFPTCLGCHAGVPEGDSARLFTVSPSDCAECHNGTELETVDWQAPSREPSNLAFSHPTHIEDVAAASDSALDCGSCHRPPGSEKRMDVVRAPVSNCLDCHAHQAKAHLAADVTCSACHLTLAAADALLLTTIAEFPQPADHEADDYIFAHAETVEADAERCAVCHVQESCARCHINASSVPVIVAMPRDERVATLFADVAGEWPAPPSHESAGWRLSHGPDADGAIGTCANCHAEPSCTGCHGTAGPAVIAELTRPRPDAPQGVDVRDPRPIDHTPGFIVAHGAAASTGLPSCSKCHSEKYCIDCHEAPASPAFHPEDFVLRHAADAYAERTECAGCHSREVFCRDCHTNLGVGVTRSSGNAYHDAQPDWLLGHGQAARQGMEQCTTCHQQTSCLRCHSAKAGWRVNPHGPDFNPDRVANKSLQSCAICHTASQIGRP